MKELQMYQDYLCYLCRQSASLEEIAKAVESGKEVSATELEKRLAYVETAKVQFLQLKEELGITGGLDFMDDVNFNGFSFKNGRLEGDYTYLEKVILPWVENFNKENPYTYEVGTLILFHYLNQKNPGGEVKRRGFISSLIGRLVIVVKKNSM